MSNTMSLQITYEGGRALAAYLYLDSAGERRSERTDQIGTDILVDYAADGTPMGIEILSPATVSLEALLNVFDRLGIPRPPAADLRPLTAA